MRRNTRYGLTLTIKLPVGEAAYTEVWRPHSSPAPALRMPYVLKWNDGRYYACPLDIERGGLWEWPAVCWDDSGCAAYQSWLGPFRTLKEAAATLTLTITE